MTDQAIPPPGEWAKALVEQCAQVADEERKRLNRLPRYGCPGASQQYRVQAETAAKIADTIRHRFSSASPPPVGEEDLREKVRVLRRVLSRIVEYDLED